MAFDMKQLWTAVQKEEGCILATCADGQVTMRVISPVQYGDAILMFTSAESQKYAQLKANPNCSIAVGGYFVQAQASFCGATMTDENAALRKVYADKFTGAFDEGIEHGGREAEFILLKPVRVTGWLIENGMPAGQIDYVVQA